MADPNTDAAPEPALPVDEPAPETDLSESSPPDTASSDPALTGSEAPTEELAESDASADALPLDDAAAELAEAPSMLVTLLGPAGEFLDKGGLAIWAIAALSVVTLAVILWKIWRFSLIGVWRKSRAERALEQWTSFDERGAMETASSGKGLRARLATAAMRCASDRSRPEEAAREETLRVAKLHLATARSGLRALELIATVAPLLGLFGTVLGMIAAFQQLQNAGARADPSALAGGIWEALLTTAAGMAVAIPASAALTWFESVTDRLRLDFEDIATRVFTRPKAEPLAHAAE